MGWRGLAAWAGVACAFGTTAWADPPADAPAETAPAAGEGTSSAPGPTATGANGTRPVDPTASVELITVGGAPAAAEPPSDAPPPVEVPAPVEGEVPVENPAPVESPALIEEAPTVAPPARELAPPLAVRKRVLPVYPDHLEALYGDQTIRCDAVVQVDDRGAAATIAVVDCPAGFHLAVLEAVGKWRWEKAPADALVTVPATVGFVRKDKLYRPGMSYLARPEQVTADPSLPVLLRGGSLPRYPAQVSYGDAVCAVELTVTASGRSKDILIDECAGPYRAEALKAVKGWSWYYPAGKTDKTTATVTVDIAFRLARSIVGR